AGRVHANRGRDLPRSGSERGRGICTEGASQERHVDGVRLAAPGTDAGGRAGGDDATGGGNGAVPDRRLDGRGAPPWPRRSAIRTGAPPWSTTTTQTGVRPAPAAAPRPGGAATRA